MIHGTVPMKWFRFYSQAMRDAKVMRLTDSEFRFWVELLAMANEEDPRGSLPSPADIAVKLRLKELKVAGVVEKLVGVGLVDRDEGGRLTPHNWTAWQHKSDDSAAVKREQRNKKRQRWSPGGGADVPGRSAMSTADVHGHVHGQSTNCPLTDTDTDTEAEAETERVCEDAGAKSEVEVDGAVGKNSAAEVREALYVADQLWPGSSVRVIARQWLADHPAVRVIAALNTAHGNGARRPTAYVTSLLDDPDFGAPRPPPPPRAAPGGYAPRPNARDERRRRQQAAMDSLTPDDLPDL